MFDNSCSFLNLHYFKRDSYIAEWLSGPHSSKRIGREGKSEVAVTHLALLGVKKQEAAFSGKCKQICHTKEKSSPSRLLFCECAGRVRLFYDREPVCGQWRA